MSKEELIEIKNSHSKLMELVKELNKKLERFGVPENVETLMLEHNKASKTLNKIINSDDDVEETLKETFCGLVVKEETSKFEKESLKPTENQTFMASLLGAKHKNGDPV